MSSQQYARHLRVACLALSFCLLTVSICRSQDDAGPPPETVIENGQEATEAVDNAADAAADTGAGTDEQETDEEGPSLLVKINGVLGKALFFDLAFGRIKIEETDREGRPILDESGQQKVKVVKLKFLVIILLLSAIFFTFWYGWINIRGFKHSVDVIRGRYDRPEDAGEITHFRALTSALSATIGLGNIAGVAIAIQLGGPGAFFWMLLTAVFGMTAKFSSCTLSQMYRQVNSDGSISGGPMYYLDLGLKSLSPGFGMLGKVLAIVFALMVMGGALGGGNMFQSNQAFEAFANTFGQDRETWMAKGSAARWAFGIVLAIFVGLVVIGGIKRIGAATARIIPFMCSIYVVTSLFIIICNFSKIPGTAALIFRMAFTDNAFFGGMVGVMIWGITRASFSNEAGLGSAAIAHAAAKTDEPVREGIVAMIGPFIDTIVVCSMTALVVIITGTWNDPAITSQGGNIGVTLTTEAFRSAISWFPYILAVCIALFAYSTMISWCYYGERGWIYLLDHLGSGIGLKSVIVFRLVFVVFVVIGAVAKLTDVLNFSDLMILSMAFPNIVGSVILAPVVLRKVKDYWNRYQAGEMRPVK